MIDIKEIELFDWFAGQALQGILSNSHYPAQSSGEPMDQYVARVTDCSYRFADAMMKQGQRLKKEKNSW